MALTTTAALAEYSGLMGNTGSKTAFNFLACGTGTAAEAASDTTLGTEITNNGLERSSGTTSQVTTTATNDTLQIVKVWTSSGTVTVAEVAMFNASSTGTMAFRDKLSSTKALVDGDTLTYTAKVVYA